jgi:signal transduction histidine kinase
MRQKVFEKEHQVLEQALDVAKSGNATPADYEKLLGEYKKLLSQGEKIVSIGDATQNKLIRAQKMLHRAIQRYKSTADQKSELLSLVSHEIKNKAAPIRELSNWAAEDLGENNVAHARELLKHICDASDQLIKSVNDTLNRESTRTTNIVPVFEWADLSNLARNTIDNQKPCAIKKNISIEAKIENGCESLVDEFLLGEVYENLVSNAIKFSPVGSRIFVDLRRDESAISFSVRDEGPGLSGEDKQRLFGKYQTLSAKPTGGEVSTGIGLFIANKLVGLHNGTLDAISDGPGKGTTFIVKLPMPKEKGGLQFKVQEES